VILLFSIYPFSTAQSRNNKIPS